MPVFKPFAVGALLEDLPAETYGEPSVPFCLSLPAATAKNDGTAHAIRPTNLNSLERIDQIKPQSSKRPGPPCDQRQPMLGRRRRH
jgi:hypothetical protein